MIRAAFAAALAVAVGAASGCKRRDLAAEEQAALAKEYADLQGRVTRARLLVAANYSALNVFRQGLYQESRGEYESAATWYGMVVKDHSDSSYAALAQSRMARLGAWTAVRTEEVDDVSTSTETVSIPELFAVAERYKDRVVQVEGALGDLRFPEPSCPGFSLSDGGGHKLRCEFESENLNAEFRRLLVNSPPGRRLLVTGRIVTSNKAPELSRNRPCGWGGELRMVPFAIYAADGR